jgi:hypothetical protein
MFVERVGSWLAMNDVQRAQCESSDDIFDALIASHVARACARNLVDPIPPADRPASLREGWIALPREGSLEELASG